MIDLDISKPRAATRVAVAMSGGVDSSVTAALLKEAGYDVIGLTLQLYDDGKARGRQGACCAGQDIYDARRVADRINIPHFVLDFEDRFRQAVIDDFADTYLAGQTPVPCVRCNQRIKFRDMLDMARDLDVDVLATGHYVRRTQDANGKGQLMRAVDHSRDQSYFLFATTQPQLDFLRFPLGGMTKPEVRAHATRHGLEIAEKPDSQDICFVPTGSYRQLVEKFRPGALTPGDIMHLDGRVLGRHDGIINFTVGQRRGIGIAEGDPIYVIRLDAARNLVWVGPKEALACDRVWLKEVNWLGDAAAESVAVAVKLRSAMVPVMAKITMNDDGTAMLMLDDPYHGVAPGQAAVFYNGDRCLGGGWIDRAMNSQIDFAEPVLSKTG
jgi:tRNA-specific 2-thiouridylase